MNKEMKLIEEKRDATYRSPERCCGTCKYFWHYSTTCQIVEDRGMVKNKEVVQAGLCDLWEGKK